MDLKEIQDLIKFVARSGVEEVELEQGSFKITIKAKSSHPAESAPTNHYMIAPPGLMPNQGMPIVQGNQAQTSSPQQATNQSATNDGSANDNKPQAGQNLIEIKSPMVGTFYRSSGPDKEPFAKVGDSIQKGSTVCIIEAMKLFNEIEAEIGGKIVKVLVDDAAPVEYDQPLFLVDPS